MKKAERGRKEKQKQKAELHVMQKEEIYSTKFHKEMLERKAQEQGTKNARKKLKYLQFFKESSEDYNVEQGIKCTNAAKRLLLCTN